MPKVQENNTVSIHYTAKTAEGGVFETSAKRDPLQFIAGGNSVIAGVSQAVIGMDVGDKKTVSISPEEGFGLRDPSLEQTIPRSFLPEGISEGDQTTATFDDHELDVWVQKLEGDEVVVDANHPLAGESLVYEIELVAINAG
ncbi:FKBP-type peptidyl-prolyl cis-trans isomerase SlyD [hydrothermal vent metagenome]|uniref:peptidylprolyl isomerase n=1 Tax=hydrothermal vent metagenome TaxID=652676 RepID=A0A3B1DZQ9_9ZZZZ